MNREQILTVLSDFARQPPRLEYGNYGDPKAFRSEARAITRDLHDAQELLAAVAMRGGISAKNLVSATSAFSGRLQLVPDTGRRFSKYGVTIEYATGQYWPTEYRKAVCAVLAAALWAYWHRSFNTGDDIRAMARNELSRGVAKRWFN